MKIALLAPDCDDSRLKRRGASAPAGKPDPAERGGAGEPDRHNEGRSLLAARQQLGRRGLCAAFGHHHVRDQAPHQAYPQGYDDQIVQQTQYRNEIRNQIDR